MCFSDARLDLSDDDAAVALAPTECSARSYAELLRSDAPSPSGLKSAKSSALKPSPPSALGVFSFGPATAAPTRGEILVHLEGISRKPRSAKRRKTNSPERGRSTPAKVQRLEAPSSPPVHRPERASSPRASPVLEPERNPPSLAKVSPGLGPLPPSDPIAEVGNPSGGDGVQPLAVVPITVWKAPSESVRSPPGKSAGPSRRAKLTTTKNKDSLLFNVELAVGAVSSILKDSDIVRSKELPVDEALASSFQGFALVRLWLCLFPY